jgi:DNA repair protein RecN (Recombination protein N)
VDTQRDQLVTESEQQRQGAAQAALELSRARQEAATGLSRSIEQELHGLAMPQARVRIEVAPREHEQGWIERGDGIRYEGGPTGMDRVTFWLGTNPGAELLPLQRVASGGEISRIMLALKSVLGRASRVPTLIFDEIDAGIGGRTADRVGECLVALARERQVIVITHLPQIARRGSRHLVVDKQLQQGRAQTCIRAVEGKQRQEELAVLMGAPGAAVLPVEPS